MPNEPQNPSKLVGSKWTALDVENRRKHWIVVAYQKDDDAAVLQAVIDKHREQLPWRSLRDREEWLPGWM